MVKPKGYNPMRWDCATSGCYNKKLRPRIEEFADCFPGSISMSDVDGIVEVSGCFLFLEWKSRREPLKTGQKLLFERITAHPDTTVVIVLGCPSEMKIESAQVVSGGVFSIEVACDLSRLKSAFSQWAQDATKYRLDLIHGRPATHPQILI